MTGTGERQEDSAEQQAGAVSPSMNAAGALRPVPDVLAEDDVPDIAFALGDSSGASGGDTRVDDPRAHPVTAAETVDAETAAADIPAGIPADDIAEQARVAAHRIGRELSAAGPPGWTRVEAVFALTTAAEWATAIFSDEQGRSVRIQPDAGILDLVREHRTLSAGLGDGPWWRMGFTVSAAGGIEVDYDYGDDPFPDDQLFAAEAYRADLEVYPRESLPVWLAAYVRHAGRQARPPSAAAARARSDREAGIRAVVSEWGFPSFPVMSARWAVLASTFTAIRSPWGPRVLPGFRWFEGAKRSGSTLYVLPGDRAVLSGGVWNAAGLDRAYNGGAPLPELYAGAPDWVTDTVLNPRAGNGLLSFCYWWEGGAWYRGQSPLPDELAVAMPGIWTSETVTDLVLGLIQREGRRAAVAALVAAAETATVTRAAVAEVYGADADFDVDGAVHQLDLAGVTTGLA